MGPISYFSEKVIDPGHYGVKVLINFVNTDPNESVALRFEPGSAAHVVGPLMVIVMVGTIDFDY